MMMMMSDTFIINLYRALVQISGNSPWSVPGGHYKTLHDNYVFIYFFCQGAQRTRCIARSYDISGAEAVLRS